MKHIPFITILAFIAAQLVARNEPILVEVECLEFSQIHPDTLAWNVRLKVAQQFSGTDNLKGKEILGTVRVEGSRDYSMPLGHIWRPGDVGLWILKSTDGNLEIDYTSSNYYQLTDVPIPIPKNPAKEFQFNYEHYFEWALLFSELKDLRSGDDYLRAFEKHGHGGGFVRYWLLHRLESLVDSKKYDGKKIKPLLLEIQQFRDKRISTRQIANDEIVRDSAIVETNTVITLPSKKETDDGFLGTRTVILILSSIVLAVLSIVWIARR